MIKQILKYVAITALAIVAMLTVLWAGLQMYDEWSGYNAGLSISDGYCNIAVLPVFGEIISYPGANWDGMTMPENLPPTVNPDDVNRFLTSAEADENILGVLTEIDSYGGSGSAGTMIADRLKRSLLPIVATVRDGATSAGYLIATGADSIIASPFSDVGSIGVTMSYLDNSIQNADQGLEFVSLSTGKFKDSGTPDKPLTEEERALFERDLNIWHEVFVKSVSENRNIPLEEVAKLADGSSMAGSLALEHKLIDSLGDTETARKWFAQELGIEPDEVVFCQ